MVDLRECVMENANGIANEWVRRQNANRKKQPLAADVEATN